MKRELSPKDILKVLAALCIIMMVTGGAIKSIKQKQIQDYRKEGIRIQTLEMGRIPEADATSLPEAEGQMSDPKFRP